MLLTGAVSPNETLCDNHTINQLGIFHECEKKKKIGFGYDTVGRSVQ